MLQYPIPHHYMYLGYQLCFESAGQKTKGVFSYILAYDETNVTAEGLREP